MMIKSFIYAFPHFFGMSYDYENDPLVKFLVDVNSDPEFRGRFLKQPIPILERMMGKELTEAQKKTIHKVRPMLLKYVEGIEDIPTGMEDLIEALKNDKELSGPVEDDSTIL